MRYKNWKHGIHTNFRKYRKNSIPRAAEIGDMKTVEHKSESRNNRQFAAVVQDLTIQWILPVGNPSKMNFTKVFRAVEEAKSYLYGRCMRIWHILWRIIMESSDSFFSSIRDKKLQNELYVE